MIQELLQEVKENEARKRYKIVYDGDLTIEEFSKSEDSKVRSFRIVNSYTKSSAPKGEISGVSISIADEEFTKRMSVCQVTDTRLFNKNQPRFNSANDPKMGPSDFNQKCVTCGGTLSAGTCTGHFGHMELFKRVYLPNFVPDVHQCVSCVCYKCGEPLLKPSDPQYAVVMKIKNAAKRRARVFRICSNISYCGGPPPISKEQKLVNGIKNEINGLKNEFTNALTNALNNTKEFDAEKYINSTFRASGGCHALQPVYIYSKKDPLTIRCFTRIPVEKKRTTGRRKVTDSLSGGRRRTRGGENDEDNEADGPSDAPSEWNDDADADAEIDPEVDVDVEMDPEIDVEVNADIEVEVDTDVEAEEPLDDLEDFEEENVELEEPLDAEEDEANEDPEVEKDEEDLRAIEEDLVEDIPSLEPDNLEEDEINLEQVLLADEDADDKIIIESDDADDFTETKLNLSDVNLENVDVLEEVEDIDDDCMQIEPCNIPLKTELTKTEPKMKSIKFEPKTELKHGVNNKVKQELNHELKQEVNLSNQHIDLTTLDLPDYSPIPFCSLSTFKKKKLVNKVLKGLPELGVEQFFTPNHAYNILKAIPESQHWMLGFVHYTKPHYLCPRFLPVLPSTMRLSVSSKSSDGTKGRGDSDFTKHINHIVGFSNDAKSLYDIILQKHNRNEVYHKEYRQMLVALENVQISVAEYISKEEAGKFYFSVSVAFVFLYCSFYINSFALLFIICFFCIVTRCSHHFQWSR